MLKPLKLRWNNSFPKWIPMQHHYNWFNYHHSIIYNFYLYHTIFWNHAVSTPWLESNYSFPHLVWSCTSITFYFLGMFYLRNIQSLIIYIVYRSLPKDHLSTFRYWKINQKYYRRLRFSIKDFWNLSLNSNSFFSLKKLIPIWISLFIIILINASIYLGKFWFHPFWKFFEKVINETAILWLIY